MIISQNALASAFENDVGGGEKTTCVKKGNSDWAVHSEVHACGGKKKPAIGNCPQRRSRSHQKLALGGKKGVLGKEKKERPRALGEKGGVDPGRGREPENMLLGWE